MTPLGYTYFDTALGRCGVVWSVVGIQALALPEVNASATAQRLARYCRSAPEQSPPESVRAAIDGVCRHLDGEVDDLRWIDLDLTRLRLFDRRVYEVARMIEPGATLTYGEVAERVDSRGAAQAVGQALGRNPVPIIVPCHRVLAAGNRIGGFSAYGGVVTKRALLTMEQAPGFDAPTLF